MNLRRITGILFAVPFTVLLTVLLIASWTIERFLLKKEVEGVTP